MLKSTGDEETVLKVVFTQAIWRRAISPRVQFQNQDNQANYLKLPNMGISAKIENFPSLAILPCLAISNN